MHECYDQRPCWNTLVLDKQKFVKHFFELCSTCYALLAFDKKFWENMLLQECIYPSVRKYVSIISFLKKLYLRMCWEMVPSEVA